jgi:Flp pilus assembly protein CpaB
MAEQTPAVQNKGMLLVAAVLGVAVVALYNYQIGAIRSESVGEQVSILLFARDMKNGEKINVANDLVRKPISKRIADGLGDICIVNSDEDLKFIDGRALNRAATKGSFFSTSMITSSAEPPPSSKITDPTHVAMVVPLREAPGDILRPGDRVNLVARVPTKDGRILPERILEDVLVLAVGGRGLRETPGASGADEGATTYRSITIEVTPEASLQLEQILTYVGGGVRVELLKSLSGREASPRAGRIKPDILQLLESQIKPGAAPARPAAPSPAN